MKNSNSKEKKPIDNAFSLIGKYIRVKYPFVILFLIGFLLLSLLNLIKVSTNDSIANFKLNDFEVGQIADRTIIANKSLAPDGINPVSIEKGEKIIKKGFPVSEEGYAKLKKMSESPVYIDYRAFANHELFLFLVAILFYCLFSFIPFRRTVRLNEVILDSIFCLAVYAAAAFCSKLVLFSSEYSICVIIPASLFIMLVTILYGQTPAVILSLIMSLLVLSATNMSLIPFLFTFSTCMISCAIVRKISRRLDLVFASLILSLVNVAYVIALVVIFNDSFFTAGPAIAGVAVNGFLSGILTLGLVTPLEFILNTSSVFRLMDLSDLNNSLMRKMLVTASGTYNHSLMVAQLAESACREIGANALVARVGAYYHDIGKIDQSEYFVENQQGVNKHNDINPSLSASVIKSHVKKGVEKARQLHLPQSVIDIISEHHGNSVIQYFYNEAVKKDPLVSPEDYSYPGTPPSTRESAVVMLADTVEAACRTLENPSVSRLDKFISQLISAKVEHKQLDNCDLTFRDISRIKEAFIQILAGYYHTRIEYPDQKDPSELQNTEESEKKDGK